MHNVDGETVSHPVFGCWEILIYRRQWKKSASSRKT